MYLSSCRGTGWPLRTCQASPPNSGLLLAKHLKSGNMAPFLQHNFLAFPRGDTSVETPRACVSRLLTSPSIVSDKATHPAELKVFQEPLFKVHFHVLTS